MSTDLSSRIRDFIKSEAVLVIAAVAAVASMAAFPLTPATFWCQDTAARRQWPAPRA